MSIDKTADAQNPTWYRDAIIYQVHIKSFFDADNDGVGDFEGLIQKLDYIADLGATAIWLLPFYPSPRRDDGYDIAEYRDVHPEYGTLETVRRFIDAAHARDLRVITELVINHTSDQHPWFQAARAAPAGSPERDFYVWSDNDDKYAGTRIIFLDTEKSNWTWDDTAGAYYWHRFYSHQPDLNFDNPAVMAEVLSVMRFWLDLGVDGLRLDAVPYLIEREGTNNENLPETHDILRAIRAEMDVYAPGKMLLAEANQWPEDAQQYFGAGDECHMSFHFPLMPRMYMAIAREDRFPITDIMRQTPEIPDGCQWAIFLRNHDELTLEMVTDQERDYLWETYASDKRARINLGIRRRLSPLVERDRRRIELLNNLLLSMPGTPVIYYGDEIGMGDNVHLGDRDGVRTPMQWSPDRNGGFSRVDPAALVLPVIMDAVAGYSAVNVENQAADAHSLLNWTRRILAVRRRHAAFGRGTQKFLYPGNRKVLAFVREHSVDGDDEVVLCVSNLSRLAQAVELDLSAYLGRVPVDAIGGSAFPPVSQLPYLLTMPPYGFFWFVLATSAALPAWHVPAPVPLPDLRTLVLRTRLEEILSPAPRTALEHDILPAYLEHRRWFAQKDARVNSVRIAYAVRLPQAMTPVLLTEIEVRTETTTSRYCLPLGGIPSDLSDPLGAQLALSRLRRVRDVGYLTDAFAVDAYATGVIAALRAAETIEIPDSGGAELRFVPTAALAAVELDPIPEIRRLSAEQSNSSLIIGDAIVLKIVRRIADGRNPEAEMSRKLTERGFANTPPLLGELQRVDAPGAVPLTLGVVQAFIRNQGDGWTVTLDSLARALDEDTGVADPFANYLPLAAAIGRRLGELHAVLAAPDDNSDFAPERVTADRARAWAAQIAAEVDATLEALPTAERETMQGARADLDGTIARLAASLPGSLATRVHGDFHLGQVLVTQGDAYIIDFEGEPARPIAERRAKLSPMRDIAGLLRSFDYAAAAGAERSAATGHTDERRAAALESFSEEARAAALAAYREVLADAEHPWIGEEAFDDALHLFLIEKAAYEIRYEAANRPAWLSVPLEGLRRIARAAQEPVHAQ